MKNGLHEGGRYSITNLQVVAHMLESSMLDVLRLQERFGAALEKKTL